jgi:hypothetical protein
MGKSVCINSLLVSLLYKAKPDEVRLILIDPKRVELSNYNGIPHLLVPVVCEPKKSLGALQWAVTEMENRFITIEEAGVRNITEFNQRVENGYNAEKMSRIVIALKGIYINIRSLINPRYVPKAKFEGKSLDKKTMNDVFSFITLYSFIMIAVIFLLSFDPVNNQTFLVVSDAGEYTQKHGFFSNFSATLSCLSNIGPGFEAIGPYSSFDNYNYFSKILLTFTMLIGRLEILPVLILFNKKTWKKI